VKGHCRFMYRLLGGESYSNKTEAHARAYLKNRRVNWVTVDELGSLLLEIDATTKELKEATSRRD
jgi:hypothetical protein